MNVSSFVISHTKICLLSVCGLQLSYKWRIYPPGWVLPAESVPGMKITSPLLIVPFSLIACNDVSHDVFSEWVNVRSLLLALALIAEPDRSSLPSLLWTIVDSVLKCKSFISEQESELEAAGLSGGCSKLWLCEMTALWCIIVISGADQWRLSRAGPHALISSVAVREFTTCWTS